MIAFSRAASFDIVVTATLAWAFAFYFAAELATSETKRTRLLIGFYFAIGLSLLAKGLVGFVIPFGVIGAYYTLHGKAPARKILISPLWGLPLSLVVAATWYGPMIWKHGSPFLVEFIVKHHFQRYATNAYHHPGPVYYYLLILPALALPWTILFVDSVWKARKVLWRGGNDASSKLQIFAVAWIAVPLIFFSFSGSKLPGYILPALPAAALLIGPGIARNYLDKSDWAVRATGALALLFGIGVLVFARQSEKISFSTAALMAAVCGVVAFATMLFNKHRKIAALWMAIATLALVVISVTRVAPALVAPESSKDLIQKADERGYANLPLFGLQRDDRSPEFYAAGRVIYGEDREPIMYDGIGQVVYESHARGRMLFLIPLQDLERLQQAQSVRAEAIANNGRIAIVVVEPQ
jgi:4-amino-4-deoxy-L-arabinose transferase-like glycosyltransferase